MMDQSTSSGGAGGSSSTASSNSNSNTGTARKRLRRKRNLAVRFKERDATNNNDTTSSPTVMVEIHEFPNPEFCCHDAKIRKSIWYTSLEIRAINQTNLDAIRQQQELLDLDQNKNNKGHDKHTKDTATASCTNTSTRDTSKNTGGEREVCCCRGLEHFLEGERERKQRLQAFVASILKLQADKKREGSRPASIMGALQNLSQKHSRADGKRSQKLGKEDCWAISEDEHRQQQQQQDGNRRKPIRQRHEKSGPPIRKAVTNTSVPSQRKQPIRKTRSFNDESHVSSPNNTTRGAMTTASASSGNATPDPEHTSKRRSLLNLVTKSAIHLTRSLRHLNLGSSSGSTHHSIQSTSSTTASSAAAIDDSNGTKRKTSSSAPTAPSALTIGSS